MRIAALNLRAYPNRSDPGDLPELIAGCAPDLVLLQECRQRWLDDVCDAADLNGIHSHDAPPGMPDWPPDGCAIAVGPGLRLGTARRIAPENFQPAEVRREIDEPTPPAHERMPGNLACRFSARTLLAEVSIGADRFVAASFHATPGTARIGRDKGTVHEFKPFFHGAVALELARLESPFVFAIDANEPRTETLDSVTFHWEEARPGARKLEDLLGLEPRHRARDLLREQLVASGEPAAGTGHLALTYDTRGRDGKRRFDSIWATSEFRLERFTTSFEEALAAGGDHALLMADLTLGG